ncbi:hypothetical protein [Candidatus Methylacidithermus pantelleriae]|uniref:Uncharacterized protein n=1 Tax=Candidatus Methylacidithermus pantelleriae TaxID=2744239 RepID=A0A8J2FS34_9BACT|nr:hypothetical protein [Candidatus Methylacidithermus pantelleriae]CAF0695990.1 hypothetical protein MPNT_20079 [Candidatus Methylacidithermus pantelleriae]
MVASLEGKLKEYSHACAQLREDTQELRLAVTHLVQKIDRFREELSGQIHALDQQLPRPHGGPGSMPEQPYRHAGTQVERSFI